jgi:hypothetical protein
MPRRAPALIGLSCSKLSRCEPFAKEMYREKAAMDSEHCRTCGNSRDSDFREGGWKSTTELPTWEYYVQIW